jgi:hypothetical protein
MKSKQRFLIEAVWGEWASLQGMMGTQVRIQERLLLKIQYEKSAITYLQMRFSDTYSRGIWEQTEIS